ncbi:MAG: hypothetical protein WCJ25_03395 [Candidatus Moraniibacteriota bacterium]
MDTPSPQPLQPICTQSKNHTAALKTVGIFLTLGILSYSSLFQVILLKRDRLSPARIAQILNPLLCTRAIVIGIGVFFLLQIIGIFLMKSRPIVNERSLLWGATLFVSIIPNIVLSAVLSRTILIQSTWPIGQVTMFFSIILALLSAGPMTMGLWDPRKTES